MDPRDQIIKLLVGAFPTDILHVHEGVLCKSSIFLKNALKPEWAGQRDDPHTIDLSDERFETVKAYINWLYSSKSAVIPLEDKSIYAMLQNEEAQNLFISLAKAYVFGEKLQDIEYKNLVIKDMVVVWDALRWSPGPECTAIIYNGTSTGSPARRFLTDIIAYTAHYDPDEPVGWMSFIDEIPYEALVDAMKATIKLRSALNSSYITNSSYVEEIVQ
ncbi:hypothetical protein P153DRAFT_396431 [Dothidotthia symphoricarpi CBS 119687]|uniref:BTB domain-containing protein n=1 Tax=Dothidotthia symphoricarpi CBS 119687 TaxID=1392245 RepID=A0A6A6AI40_9PLEO|nr:uncharacterized protein P153DRAFT_396431 [Dothidotthia symphoricarpi CBS 119687]KAF2130101.1 hypothetical protein P153DRAFT_396431 [Dothidotthia symphoricarpi CBS 119687]